MAGAKNLVEVIKDVLASAHSTADIILLVRKNCCRPISYWNKSPISTEKNSITFGGTKKGCIFG